jgi:hypothetical protein
MVRLINLSSPFKGKRQTGGFATPHLKIEISEHWKFGVLNDWIRFLSPLSQTLSWLHYRNSAANQLPTGHPSLANMSGY